MSRTLHVSLVWLSLLLAGCAGFAPAGGVPWHVNDPPQLSPYGRSLDDAGIGGPRAPGVAEDVRRRFEAPDPGGLARPSAPVPRQPDVPAVVTPAPATSERPLVVTLAAPDAVSPGDPAWFDLIVRNDTPHAAEDVHVICRFDEELEFPGSRERWIEQPLGRIEPGASRELTLSLRARTAGRPCAEFTVTSGTHAAARASACLDVLLRTVELEVVGPDRRTIGGRAEYVVTVINVSGHGLPGTRVAIEHDPVLALREVSAGADRGPGRLAWELGELLVDERVQLQVEFECTAEARSACVQVSVSGDGFAARRHATCLDVAPRRAIDLHVGDTDDPISVGGETTYAVRVENLTAAAAAQVRLSVVHSANVEVVGGRVRRDETPLDLSREPIEGGLSFAPIASLAAGGVVTWEIDVVARAAGVAEFRALLHASVLPAPLEAVEKTVVNPPLASGTGGPSE